MRQKNSKTHNYKKFNYSIFLTSKDSNTLKQQESLSQDKMTNKYLRELWSKNLLEAISRKKLNKKSTNLN